MSNYELKQICQAASVELKKPISPDYFDSTGVLKANIGEGKDAKAVEIVVPRTSRVVSDPLQDEMIPDQDNTQKVSAFDTEKGAALLIAAFKGGAPKEETSAPNVDAQREAAQAAETAKANLQEEKRKNRAKGKR